MTAGHDIEYPLRSAGSAVAYYLQDGKEPPGVWAGTAAGALGLTGQVDPETYRALFGKLIAPTGERLYSGRPPRYADGTGRDKDEAAAAAVAALGEFATPAEARRTRAKVLGSTGAAVPFYDLTLSATKSVSLLQASYAATAARARGRGDTATADACEARVRAIDDAAVETARQVIALAEQRALFVRTGHHSAHTGEFRDAAGAVAALFPQHDNRSGEPNLHVHTVLLNRAVRADAGDGKWRALYGKALWDEQLGLGADAERIFARLLTLLGIPLAQQDDGNAFEVGGVEQATMDAFSTRTRGQIDPKAAAEEAEYKRLYGREPSARTRWEWRQPLARSTRKAKPDELSRAQAERTIRIAVAEVQSRHAAFSASQLLWELHRALPERNQDAARAGDWPETCICGEKHRVVFTTRNGRPIEPRNINRAFSLRCARYGVRRISVHDTRRTCASLLAALDVHPRVAMAILRHSRVSLTMEIYPGTGQGDQGRAPAAERPARQRPGRRGQARCGRSRPAQHRVAAPMGGPT